MSAQLLAALVAGAALLLNLIGIIIILRIKVAVSSIKIDMLTTFQDFREEMQKTYVLREVYDRDHPHLQAHHR